MRRRRLGFGTSESRMNHLDDDAGSGCSVLQQSSSNSLSSDQHLVSSNMGNELLGCILGSLGLHLNALAATHKDYKNEASDSRRYLIGSSSSAINSLVADQEFQTNTLDFSQLKRKSDTLENCVLPIDDDGGVSAMWQQKGSIKAVQRGKGRKDPEKVKPAKDVTARSLNA